MNAELAAESEIRPLATLAPNEGPWAEDECAGDDDCTPDDGEPAGSHDLSDDADALASAGHGMDEDYYLDASYEDRTDCGE